MTTDDRSAATAWNRIWDLFHDALELPAAERDAYIDKACGSDHDLKARVQKLLTAHDSSSDELFDKPPAVLSEESQVLLEAEPQPGDEIGVYTLQAMVGEGGMGVVYLAEQREPVKRLVALKLLHLGMATREVMARFETERQALAMMNHSNIAKVYDAGATETGQPFFVMEYVDGVPITDFCDNQRLSIKARIGLFLSVCDGILHAHQKGIIHRDIKPSNVLVTMENDEPVPKIIDFGIAKATEQTLSEETLYTQSGAMIGTPGHMSPEQAGVNSLDVDTRADVYSLGVLLYQLLVGVLPLASITKQRGFYEIQEAIRSEEPQRPSQRLSRLADDDRQQLVSSRDTTATSLRKALDSDISWISLKAMEKDRERRYTSVADLAADVRRYLSGLPVQARAPTTLYRMSRFARRHTFGVAVAASIAALTLFFAGFMTWQTLRLQQALEDTTLERNRAEKVSEFMVQLFDAANPVSSDGESVSVRDMLDQGVTEIDSELQDQPVLRAKLLATMAESYRVLGGSANAERAVELLQQALTDLESLSEPPVNDKASTLNNLGEAHHEIGDFDKAEKYYRMAGELQKANPTVALGSTEEDPFTNLVDVLTDRGAMAEAESAARDGLRLHEITHGQRSAQVARITERLALILHRRGDSESAVALMDTVLEIKEELYGEEHAFVATTLNYYASIQGGNGDTHGAINSLKRAADIYRRVLGDDHLYLATTLSNLGLQYNQIRDYQEGVKAQREAFRIGVAAYGAEHPRVNAFRINLATTLQDTGRFAEAEPLLREGLIYDRRDLDAQSPFMIATLDRFGGVLDSLGKHEEAEPLLQEAVATRVEALGPDHSDTGAAMLNLAMNLLAQGELERAEEIVRQSIAVQSQGEPGDRRKRLADSTWGLGRVMHWRDDRAAARALYEEALDTYDEDDDSAVASKARIRVYLADLAEDAGDDQTAESEYAAILPVLKELLPDSHADISRIETALGRVRCRRSSGEQGLDLIRAARPRFETSLSADNWQLAIVESAIGECLTEQGAYPQAEERLVASHEIVLAARGEDHYLTRKMRSKIDQLYGVWEKGSAGIE